MNAVVRGISISRQKAKKLEHKVHLSLKNRAEGGEASIGGGEASELNIFNTEKTVEITISNTASNRDFKVYGGMRRRCIMRPGLKENVW